LARERREQTLKKFVAGGLSRQSEKRLASPISGLLKFLLIYRPAMRTDSHAAAMLQTTVDALKWMLIFKGIYTV